MRKSKVNIGDKYGKLTVTAIVGTKRSYKLYSCLCDCGNTVDVISASLTSGNTKTCGCTKNSDKIKHGESLDKCRIYRCWSGMRNRCNCKNRDVYKYYGGRGITVCNEWNDYLVFKKWALENGYADNLTLDRINTDGNYEPSNCRWITIQDQQTNRRKRTNGANRNRFIV